MPLEPPPSKRDAILMMRALHRAELHELTERADVQLFDAVFSLQADADASVRDYIVQLARKQGGTAELQPNSSRTIHLAGVTMLSYIHAGLTHGFTKWMAPYLFD